MTWQQKAVNGLATVLGLIILIPFCAAEAWEDCPSTINPFGRAPRTIDRWKWGPLNRFYGNREDGVSARYALIQYWDDTTGSPPGSAPIQIRYRFNLDASQKNWPRLRAWLWSAWRNSAHELIVSPYPP